MKIKFLQKKKKNEIKIDLSVDTREWEQPMLPTHPIYHEVKTQDYL